MTGPAKDDHDGRMRSPDAGEPDVATRSGRKETAPRGSGDPSGRAWLRSPGTILAELRARLSPARMGYGDIGVLLLDIRTYAETPQFTLPGGDDAEEEADDEDRGEEDDEGIDYDADSQSILARLDPLEQQLRRLKSVLDEVRHAKAIPTPILPQPGESGTDRDAPGAAASADADERELIATIARILPLHQELTGGLEELHRHVAGLEGGDLDYWRDSPQGVDLVLMAHEAAVVAAHVGDKIEILLAALTLTGMLRQQGGGTEEAPAAGTPSCAGG